MRCKVVCSMKQPYNNSDGNTYGYSLSFSPVYSGSKENENFFKYTPSGTVIFNVLNLGAAANFEQGKEYYLDFTPALVSTEVV